MTKETASHSRALEFLRRQQPEETDESQGIREIMLAAMGERGAALQGIFECMAIAEEEIAAAQEAHPDKAGDIWHSFTHLRPSPLLEPRTPQLYRAHARELIQRVAAGHTKKAELAAATAAELCCVFCAASQLSGLQSDAVAAYQKLFKQVFPDVFLEDEVTIQESYPGRADEIIAELRRKVRQPRH